MGGATKGHHKSKTLSFLRISLQSSWTCFVDLLKVCEEIVGSFLKILQNSQLVNPKKNSKLKMRN